MKIEVDNNWVWLRLHKKGHIETIGREFKNNKKARRYAERQKEIFKHLYEE